MQPELAGIALEKSAKFCYLVLIVPSPTVAQLSVILMAQKTDCRTER